MRNHVAGMDPDVIKVTLGIHGFPPPNLQPWFNHERNIRQNPIKGHTMKFLISITQNHQGHLKQGKSEKLSYQRKA